MKKYIILIIILITLITSLFSDEITSSRTFYVKGGVSFPPSQKNYMPLPTPALGIGSRYQRGNCGFDLSLNLNSIIVINYVSVKGVFLYYPFPANDHRLYMGIGPGLGYNASIGGEGGCGSLEGIIGYEFRCSSRFRPFIQLELTQPVVRFKSKGPGQYQPGVAISIGVGF